MILLIMSIFRLLPMSLCLISRTIIECLAVVSNIRSFLSIKKQKEILKKFRKYFNNFRKLQSEIEMKVSSMNECYLHQAQHNS